MGERDFVPPCFIDKSKDCPRGLCPKWGYCMGEVEFLAKVEGVSLEVAKSRLRRGYRSSIEDPNDLVFRLEGKDTLRELGVASECFHERSKG